MTAVPLPDTPCVRVRLIGSKGTGFEWGNRLFFSYAGSAPSGATLNTLASDIATAWGTDIAPLMFGGYALQEVDVLDIASDSGNSGVWTGSVAGTRGGSALPIQCAMTIEFDIARRYRGGKPRIYLNAGVVGDDSAVNQWSSAFVTASNTGFGNFIAAIEALTPGSMTAITHVNLSYYKGFTNIINSSGRERAVPTYRATALHDVVTGYAAKFEISSQRRRRSSTSP